MLIRLTIQLKSLPYNALDMASLTSAALSTVLVRMMVSPLVTTQCEVRASCSSSEPMQSNAAAFNKKKTTEVSRDKWKSNTLVEWEDVFLQCGISNKNEKNLPISMK